MMFYLAMQIIGLIVLVYACGTLVRIAKLYLKKVERRLQQEEASVNNTQNE